MSRPTVERGAQRALAMRRSGAALCRKVYSLLELLRIGASAAGCGEHSVDPPCRYGRLLENLEEPLVGRTPRLDSGLCCKGFDGKRLQLEKPADEPFPTDGCSQVGPRGWLCNGV